MQSSIFTYTNDVPIIKKFQDFAPKSCEYSLFSALFDLFRKWFLIFGIIEQAYHYGVTILAKIDYFKNIACFKFDIFHFVNLVEEGWL